MQTTEIKSLGAEGKNDYNKQWGYFKNTNKLYINKNNKEYKLENIFNFITAAVNTDIALLMKGAKIVADSQELTEILNAIYKNFRKDLFSLNLAVYGNAYIKLEVDEQNRLITLKVLYPPNVYFVKDADGNIIEAFYSYADNIDGKSATVKEIYTREKIERYIDGKKEEEKENKYGFVPIFHIMFIDTGEKFGANTFDQITTAQDVINAYANIIYNVGEKMLDPVFLIKGEFTAKDRTAIVQEFVKNILEGVNVLVTTPNGGAEVVGGGMENTDKALEFIDKIQNNIYQNLPELLLYKIADKNASGYALNMMLLGLKTKIEGARENIARELCKVNECIYKILVSWGKISVISENFTDVKFGEVFDFTVADKQKSVLELLDKNIITEDIARQKLGIEWTGKEKKEEKKEDIKEDIKEEKKSNGAFKKFFGKIKGKIKKMIKR